MFPYLYPPDAITLHFATSTNSAAFTLLDVPTDSVYTILGVSNSSRVANSITSVLRCGASDNIVSFNRGTGGFFELLTFKCNDDIILALGGGTPPAGFEVSGNIVYVEYEIDQTTMATDTPFTAQQSFQDGTLYSYNPLLAQVGITIFAISFIIMVAFVYKLFRKS